MNHFNNLFLRSGLMFLDAAGDSGTSSDGGGGDSTPPPAAIAAADMPLDHAALKAAGVKGYRDSHKTFGDVLRDLGEAQTALRNPKVPESYDLADLKAKLGPDDDFSDLTAAAKAAKMTESQFKAFSENYISAVETGTKEANDKRAAALKEAGVDVDKLGAKFKALSGDTEIDLTNVSPEVLKGLGGILDRATASGLNAPDDTSSAPKPAELAEQFSMEVGGKRVGVDMSGSTLERQTRLAELRNMKVEHDDGTGTKKMLPLHSHPKFKAQFNKVYDAAMREIARLG